MRALKVAGYVAFFILWLVIGLYYSFPWNVVKDLAFAKVKQQSGVVLSARDVSPYLLSGVSLSELKVKPNPASDAEVVLDRVKARVGILSLLTGTKKISTSIDVGKGSIDAVVKLGKQTTDVDSEIRGVHVDEILGLADLTGITMSGGVSGDIKLTLSQTQPKDTQGDIAIKLADFKLKKGGKLAILPFDELELGNVDLKIPVKEGKIQLDKEKVEATDLSLLFAGTVNLAMPIGRSMVNMIIGVKPKDKINSKLGPILMGFRQFMNPEGYYGLGFNGILGGIRVPRGVRPP